MSWFGGGSSKSTGGGAALGGSGMDSFGSSSSSSDSFSSLPPPAPAPPSSMPGGASYAGVSAQDMLQVALLQEQSRAAVTAAVAKLTELCFAKCVTSPGQKLSSSETSCIQNTAERYLDSSVFVMTRLMKSQGAGREPE